jgi:hypothetical protein
MSSRGRAAQLIFTIGPSLRGLREWMRSAMTSLPVPLSPVMSTETSLGAIFSMVRTTSFMSGHLKMGAVPPPSRRTLRSLLFSSAMRLCSSAWATRRVSSAGWTGLVWTL